MIPAMPVETLVQRVSVPCAPPDVVRRWPHDRPLAMLHSGGDRGRWTRWSIFAAPEAWLPFDRPASGSAAKNEDPLAVLDEALSTTRVDGARAPVPFAGGWIAVLDYALGAIIEPAAREAGRPRRTDPTWPPLAVARCRDALVHDHASSTWYAVGDVEDILAALAREPAATRMTVGTWSSSLAPDEHLSAVRRALDYIAAGDIFQANVTQRLRTSFDGSTRELAARAGAVSGARYGAYIELPDDRCVVSMSPELFLSVDDGTVVTRPIKGTRPATTDPAELEHSEKDAAELNMIIDLMRNDLGRVCAPGTVRVTGPRSIESHPTVHHGVGEVTGRLRPQVSAGDLLRATFPPGSVTGAPKIRAMQIIDELEPHARGPYCGAIGYFSDTGDACLSVAIRTAHLHGTRPAGAWDALTGTIDYGVGGGIVADSEPLAEYRECMDKAEVLRLALTESAAPCMTVDALTPEDVS
jgi:anthranilate/para-aminobenzoate synthase component I